MEERTQKPRRTGSRTFVREVSSREYDLTDLRMAQRLAPRVRRDGVALDPDQAGHAGGSSECVDLWRLGPGDEPFLTQTLQIQVLELAPGGSNRGHGHQNEAVIYVLEGTGHEIHDDERYDWEQGDLVAVHNDSVHRHFNDSVDDRARLLVMKAKSLWMFLGLTQQGRNVTLDLERFGDRQPWSQLWTPGTDARPKVVKASEREWTVTPDGRIRTLSSADDDVRVFSVDVYEQEIAPGERSATHWHMADEVLYVLSGTGVSHHWEVEAEIADRYYARVAIEPTSHEFTQGDVAYIPQNTVHEHVNNGDQPLRFLCIQNRVFKLIGYDSVVYPSGVSKSS